LKRLFVRPEQPENHFESQKRISFQSMGGSFWLPPGQ